jgi:exonuclease SbcC
MRPVRLEIEGFASFRDRIEIDFEGADLFVLFGPTGAGKSSVIDALGFALYGSVPRYDDARLVAPVISQGMNEARVRLDFGVGGDTYTAVRVVRRTKTGATTREARLQRGEQVLAGTADELTLEVEKLLGLPFQHFTRCVVLPQGDFADFLHAKAGERQELLIRLLGLDVYRRIAQTSNQRASADTNRAALIAERLSGELACATDDALADAVSRVDDLSRLLGKLEQSRAELAGLVDTIAKSDEAAKLAATRSAALDAVRTPDGIEDLARELADSTAATTAAEDALAAAVTAREAEEQQRRELPERAVLAGTLEKHTTLVERAGQRAEAEARLQESAGVVDLAAGELANARDAAATAEAALQQVRRERAAAHLAEHLHVGEPCPVCHRAVESVPEHAPPAELDAARSARAEAEGALERARTAHAAAERSRAARQRDVEHLRTEIERLDAELAAAPSKEDATAQLEAIDRIEKHLANTQRRERDARDSVDAARKRAQRLDRDRQAARRAWSTAVRELATHGFAPPVHEGDDLREDWHALVAWASSVAPAEREAADTHRRTGREAEQAFERIAAQQLEACASADVAVPPKQEPRDACADALASARADAERIRRDLDTARLLRVEHDAVRLRATVARELGRQLDARNFERWLMNRALRQLVVGASRVLLQLSGEAFSLALDDRNEFQVIDHRNADERRMARTLSGGETFLASLALALALAEHVADLASGGAARLDALFLDEGFGTLDADTLDTVAAAIEELGSRGRMVGLVTHVRDLAERMPVRFEVRKVGSVSTVERVDA